jgi:hypothetical protein
MLQIGAFTARTCRGIRRRSFLSIAASAPAALGLPEAVLVAKREAKARSVLFIFLWGAPSHLDTCDPKPHAPVEYRGPFDVIATRTPGVHFTELLPRMAERSERFTRFAASILMSAPPLCCTPTPPPRSSNLPSASTERPTPT